jgi:hypothetical protein
MSNNAKVMTKIFNFELAGFAYFEDRRFKKHYCEELVFINKSYIIEHFPEYRKKILHYSPQESPLSLSEERRELFIPILELKILLSSDFYNKILTNLVKEVNSFEQVNILFKFLIEHDNYNSNSINAILRLSLHSTPIKRSFNAQRGILKLVLRNVDLIEPNLIQKILSDFPHRSTSPISPDQDKHNELAKKIEQALNEKEKQPEYYEPDEQKRNTRNPYSSFDWNHEIEAGEDELRKWDREDSDWRIANDLD